MPDAFVPDTSCLIPAICSWHEHHALALKAIEERLSRKERMVIAAPALLEAYAVLTRLPSPHRLRPDQAGSLLEVNFVRGGKVLALEAGDYLDVLRETALQGVAGGRIYDALIAACARRARARTLLTFNARDFSEFASPTLTIAVPGAR
jgi:predicted nucleic acid-binding protein